MRKRRLKFIGLILLGLLLLPMAFLVLEHVRGRIELAGYQRTLLAQGVKLSPQGFGSAPGAEENGAPEVMEGYQELKKGAVLPNDYPPAMKLTPSGRAVVGFRREQWSENKVTNRWDDLEFAKAMMRGLQPVAISCHRCCPPSKTKDSAQPLRLMQAVEGRISPI